MDQDTKKTLGNYRLGRLLGQGGFAEVYFGEHIYLKTPAAIKVLHITLNAETLANFLLEARTIAHMEHPHIVRVLEFGIEENTPYLVMNYAPHGSLCQKHPRGQALPLAVVVQYVRQIAAALHYAHNHLLVHRDVKPENVLLGRTDELMLSDFGLAIVTQNGHHWNRRGEAGTTTYMAPEQLRGEPCYASDQYSLGIMVYEWLCGKTPFTGTGREIAVQHQQMLPPSLCSRVPGLAFAVEHVVMKALAKDPEKRYPDVTQFAAALGRAYTTRAAQKLATHYLEELQPDPPFSEVGLLSEIPPLKKREEVLLRHQAQDEPLTSGSIHTSSSGEQGTSSDEEIIQPAKHPEGTPDFDLPPLFSLDVFPTMAPDVRAKHSLVLPQNLSVQAVKPTQSVVIGDHKGKIVKRAGLVALFCALVVGALTFAYIEMAHGGGQSASRNGTGVHRLTGAPTKSGATVAPPGPPTIQPYSPGGTATQQGITPTVSIPASKTPTASVPPTASVTPTVSATPTGISGTAALTVMITSIPTQAKKNSFIAVQVHTNSPNINVKVVINYTLLDIKTSSASYVTDASGNATIYVRLHFVGNPNTSAEVTATAMTDNQQVESETHQLQLV